VHDEGKCRVSRIWIRGSNMGVRIFAVGLLVLGIATGLTAGFLKRDSDTVKVKPQAQFKEQQVQPDATIPPPDTNNAQPLPAGARVKQAKERAAAEALAKARAKAKADAARRAAKARAEAAKKAAAERASRSKVRPPSGGSSGPPGEAPPAVPVDCKSLSGNRQIGCSLLSWAGFPTSQFSCLDKLFKKESGWRTKAENPSSGAYGIPQALPRTKMAKYGADYLTNPVPQIKWGLMYIKGRYGDPCGAWQHSVNTGWY
jgi:hypothetical protein